MHGAACASHNLRARAEEVVALDEIGFNAADFRTIFGTPRHVTLAAGSRAVVRWMEWVHRISLSPFRAQSSETCCELANRRRR